jgi:hypothetical protein
VLLQQASRFIEQGIRCGFVRGARLGLQL